MATQKKFLVYEAFSPPYEHPIWKAVEASGEHGLMEGMSPRSRVLPCWADSPEAAIDKVKAVLAEGSNMAIEVIEASGPHRLVKFPDGKGGFYYRSETVLGGMLLGSTYNTLEAAEQDYRVASKEEA